MTRMSGRINELEAENTRLGQSLNKVQLDPSGGLPDTRVPLAKLKEAEAQLGRGPQRPRSRARSVDPCSGHSEAGAGGVERQGQ